MTPIHSHEIIPLTATASRNGRVHVGSDGGYLYCFDALTDDPNGTLVWEYYS